MQSRVAFHLRATVFTEEDAEDIVADNDREAHEDDSSNLIDPMINLQSACEKIRKISWIVQSSPQRMELFKTIATRIEEDKERQARLNNQVYMKKRVKNLVLDVVTQWNSLYFMLERALEFKEAIDALCLHSTVKIYQPYAPSKSNWSAISQICGWLKFFRGATQKMSGEKYPTLSFSLRVYSVLINYVSKLEETPMVQLVPSVLNGLQACKSKLLEFFDQSTFDSEYYYFATDSLFKTELELFSEEWTEDCAIALRETCELHYMPESALQASLGHHLPAQTDPNDFESAWQVGIRAEIAQDPAFVPVASEISMYLAEPITQMKPLDWWRENHSRFPRLAAMARDFLCIPGSSVAVERVLSAGRDVISLRRASLAATTIRVLMTYRAGLLLERPRRLV